MKLEELKGGENDARRTPQGVRGLKYDGPREREKRL